MQSVDDENIQYLSLGDPPTDQSSPHPSHTHTNIYINKKEIWEPSAALSSQKGFKQD